MRNFRTRLVVSTVLLVSAVMIGVVVVLWVALELTENEQRAYASDHVLYTMVILAAITVILVGVVAWVTTRRVLDPVRQMAERAEEWSAQDLGRRFGLGAPVNEFAQLGHTLDHLLDRVAQAIRDEQRLTSELAHELRTPLTAVRGSAEIALLRAPEDQALQTDLREIAAAATRMDLVISTLLDVARNRPVEGASQVSEIVEAVSALVPPHLVLEVRHGRLPSIAANAELAVRALAPLVDNAVDHARHRITLAITAEASGVVFAISDDGDGIGAEPSLDLFTPGSSGNGGTGLGLGISRRVARSLGGDVTLDPAADRPTTFRLRLPARAPRSDPLG